MSITTDQIAELYIVAFNRAAEKNGLEGWVNLSNAKNLSIIDTANLMLDTLAAKELYGSAFNSNEAFINEVYKNALGKDKTTDAAGIAAWTGFLDNGMSRGEVVSLLIDTAKSDAAKAADPTAAKILENKINVSKYMATKFYDVPKKADGTFNFDIFKQPLAEVKVDNLADVRSSIDKLATQYDVGTPAPAQPSVPSGTIKLYDGISVGYSGGIDQPLTSVLHAGDVIYGLGIVDIIGSTPEDLVVYKNNGLYLTDYGKQIKDSIYVTDVAGMIGYLPNSAKLPSAIALNLKPFEITEVTHNSINIKGDIDDLLNDGKGFIYDFAPNSDNQDVLFLHTGNESKNDLPKLLNIAKDLSNKKFIEHESEGIYDGKYYTLLDIDESNSMSSGDVLIGLAGSNDETDPIISLNFIEIF